MTEALSRASIEADEAEGEEREKRSTSRRAEGMLVRTKARSA